MKMIKYILFSFFISLLIGCGGEKGSDDVAKDDSSVEDNKTKVLVISTDLNSNNIFLDETTNLVWTNNSKDTTIKKDFTQAQDYCKNLNIDKYSNWRIPSLKELFTIVDITNYNPAVKDIFSYTAPSGYWSSDNYPLDNNLIMGINFYDGSDGLSNKTTTNYIRCVSGEELANLSFVRDEIDEVVESSKMVQFQDNSEVKENFVTYEDAISYCDKLDLSNKSDWRIPTINELRSIVNRDNSNPAINHIFLNNANEFFWSSTPYQQNKEKIWTIFFRDGVDYQSLKTDKAYIRCVREVKYETR